MTQPYYDPAAQQQPGPYPPGPPQQVPQQPPYQGQQPGPQQWQQPQQQWQQPGPPQQQWQQPQQQWQQPQQQWQQPQQQWQGQPGPGPQGPPMPKVGIADFYDDPATGEGQSINGFFKQDDQPMFGQSLTFQVARALSDSDVRVQTKMRSNEIATFGDGRPKKVLVIPVRFQPNVKFKDGLGTWWVRGQARDALSGAMALAQVPPDANGHLVPEEGATITLTLMGSRQVPGWNDALVWQVVYYRPGANGQVPQQAPVQDTVPPQYAQQQFAQQVPNGQPVQVPQPAYAQTAPQEQFQQAPQQQVQQQPYGMQGPAAQVAAATQAAQAAAAPHLQGQQQMPQGQVPQAQFQAPQGQVPQAQFQQQMPPGQVPQAPADRMNLLATLAGPQAAQQVQYAQPQQIPPGQYAPQQ
jgi:hypothetical protein